MLALTESFSLSPLTNDHGDDPVPKALLPIANKPMLSYVLTWIEDSGLKGTFHRPLHRECTSIPYTDVMLACPASHSRALTNYLDSDESSNGLNISLEPFDTEDPTTGSMEVLAKVIPKCQVRPLYEISSLLG